MKWIRSHKVITCIIAVLLISGGIFAYSASHDGGSGPAGKGITEAVTTGDQAVTEGSKGVKGVFKGIFRFRTLTEENEALREENEKLKKELAESEFSEQELKELKKIAKDLNYDLVDSDNIVTANIASFDGTTWLNMMNINVGSKDGITENCAAISGNGLVGRVTETGRGWSRIVSIVDDENRTSFRVKGKKKILGILYGDGHGGLTGYTFESAAKIKKGDELVTSGMGLYPAGLSIGTVTEAKYSEDTQLKMIKVEPVVDFRNLTKVSVIL